MILQFSTPYTDIFSHLAKMTISLLKHTHIILQNTYTVMNTYQ